MVNERHFDERNTYVLRIDGLIPLFRAKSTLFVNTSPVLFRIKLTWKQLVWV